MASSQTNLAARLAAVLSGSPAMRIVVLGDRRPVEGQLGFGGGVGGPTSTLSEKRRSC